MTEDASYLVRRLQAHQHISRLKLWSLTRRDLKNMRRFRAAVQVLLDRHILRERKHRRRPGQGRQPCPELVVRRLPQKLINSGLYLYCLTARDLESVKIGTSWDPAGRLKQLQVGCPTELSLERAIPVGSRYIEDDIKSLFRHLRPHNAAPGAGEWYRFTDELRAWLDNLRELSCRLQKGHQPPR